MIVKTSFIVCDYHDIDAKMKLHNFLFRSFSLNVGFLIETLMREIKPVVTEKNEYEYRAKSILVAPFSIFGK